MSGILRTLIIEDSEDDALLLVHDLSEGDYQPHWLRVDTPEELTTALAAEEWDIIFADYSMPQFSGTHALSIVRERGLDTPFIFVSGTIGEDTAVEAMRAGAQDYVMKGNRKRLLPAVEREMKDAEQRRQRRRSEQELELLQTIAHAATAAGDLHAALSVTLTKICETTGWTLAQAWIPRADGAAIECGPAWCCYGNGLEKFRTASLSFAFGLNEDLPGKVWSSKQPVWVHDVQLDTHYARAPFARETGLQAALGIPVIADKEVLAVLEFLLREPRPGDERLTNFVAAVAEQLGGVMQRKRTEERLHYLAHYDALTGLPNRVLFVDRLNQAILEANRHDRILGVAFLDLDRFKTINDSLGHGIGDLLIKSAAERLLRCVRDGDTVARLAGDEFTVILADMGHVDHAAYVAKKILNSLALPFHIAGHELFSSASLGMTLYPFDEGNVDGLLRNADIAMYRAKEAGGNAYAFYSSDMMVKARERLELENDLRHAIEHSEFMLYYQPVIDLKSGKLEALETLVRWLHPTRGIILPSEFIPLAEESGLIVYLGEWVLHTACEQFEAFRRLHPDLRLAVNLSVRQFQQPDLPDMINAILRRTGFKPAALELEITESLLMQNVDNALAVMRKLNDLGVKFSVDDFGTGYSSLTYLKRLPISRVKIDQSFVRDIPTDPNDVAIVSAIISMAHNLGLQVTAEGVETPEQLALLSSRGCDAVQGFYFGQPVSMEETTLFLQKTLDRQ
ncbi:MAG: EAL domain-containing protein [Gammaproteobacteria bacterium]|nr:EAL domain-containing protein [Gammaproteobacteria bacterium]